MIIRLTTPTDFHILNALSDGERDTTANIASQIDKERGYLNTRLPALADFELLRKIGPHANSGLYQITPLGVAAMQRQSLYETNREQFEVSIHELAGDISIKRSKIIIG